MVDKSVIYIRQWHIIFITFTLKKDLCKREYRLLQHIEIPEKYQGDIMNICFNYIQSPDEPVAIRAFSITILENLSKKYPDILPELKLIVEQLPHQTAAFISRAKKILK